MIKGMFPVTAGISEMRGILRIINEHRNSMSLSGLANETGMGINSLFPLLDACTMLDLCTIRNGVVRVSGQGERLISRNEPRIFARRLLLVEPFRSISRILDRHNEMGTHRLAAELAARGISFYNDSRVNEQLMRMLLLKWGVRSGVLHYDHAKDAWRMRTARPRLVS